jgi:predicted AAA+ superfamily ATPase
MENHYKSPPLEGAWGGYDYELILKRLEKRGVEFYGKQFKILEEDKELLHKLLCYFLKDASAASQLGINLEKGILLTGPIGCGKTTLMHLLRFCEPSQNRFIIKSCRDISFEFIEHGYSIIPKYSTLSFQNHEPKIYCFDDLGTENNLKFFGNECNIMAEILLSRYDQFVSRNLITHITTNLSATEIEAAYGNRVRSRMRELFNLIAFNRTSTDKRK